MHPESWPVVRWLALLEWLLALAWITRAATTRYHQSNIPNLLKAHYAEPDTEDPGELTSPALSVIVPALNEAEAIGTCLRSLLASRGLRLEILAVNDRSTDATGAIMDQVAAEVSAAVAGPHTLRVLHIDELPAGWLGKPHALALAARQSTAPFLLFTDADAFYAPDALVRCMRLVRDERADHLVLLPTAVHKSAGERMMLGMIQALAIWGPRLWKIADPCARDSLGVGCSNLLRREAYEAIGGFEALRMEVVEDLRLGYLIKKRRLRQRVALGHDLLRLHWASGALGIVGNLEKNFFALCRYQLLILIPAVAGMALLTLAPVAGLLGPAALRLPSLLALLTLLTLYAANARRSRIPAWYALLFPVAICLLLYGMVRSAALTIGRGGVRWRGTFYPLVELRRQAGRLWW